MAAQVVLLHPGFVIVGRIDIDLSFEEVSRRICGINGREQGI